MLQFHQRFGTHRRSRKRELTRAQALVEFTLVLPILLLFFMGIFDFGRVLTAYVMVSNGIRDSLRQATILGYQASVIPPYRDCKLLRETASRAFFVSPDEIHVSYLDQDNLSFIIDPDSDPDDDGTPITDPLGRPITWCLNDDFPDELLENGDIVQISYDGTVQLITPFVTWIAPSLTVNQTGNRTLVKDIVLHGNTGDCVDDPLAAPEDYCDIDFDGLPDWWESWHFGTPRDLTPTSNELVLYGANEDPDGDGCPNGCEATRWTDPISPLNVADTDPRIPTTSPKYPYTGTDSRDTDGDGLTDNLEAFVFPTDPLLQDTDADCIRDDVEVNTATFTSLGYRASNPRDPDTDGDTLSDGAEMGYCQVTLARPNGTVSLTIAPSTNPTSSDSDYDILNGVSDGLTDLQELIGFDIPGYGLCVPNPLVRDTDGDGIMDGVEISQGRNPCAVEIPTISISSAFVGEGDIAVFTVILSNPNLDPSAVTEVDYATADMTATAGVDYVVSGGKLTFSGGVTSQTLSVPILNDSEDEPAETFSVILSNPVSNLSPSPVIGSGTGTGTIDDDDNPTINITTAFAAENAGTIEFLLTLTGPSDQPISVNFATTNGTAISPSDFTAVSGIINFSPGQTTQTLSISLLDDFTDEDDENFTVGLFGSSQATIGVGTATGTIIDNDSAPIVTVTGIAAAVTEGATTATFSVNLSAASGKPITVDYTTQNGTATAGSDFTAQTGSLIFPTGSISQQITVVMLDDTLDEVEETFQVLLTTAGNASIGTTNSATGIIFDNDGPGISIVANVSAAENAGTMSFTVSLSAASVQAITVDFSTLNGTASSGSDFTPASGTLTFGVGELNKTISVSIVNDNLFELAETFAVVLSNPTNATITIGASVGNGTIQNDDAPPTVSISLINSIVSEGGGTAVFSVTLSNPSVEIVSVNFATVNGTATGGSDFTARTGTVSFSPGTTSQSISITLTDDTTDEVDENFSLQLSSPVNAALGTPSTASILIDDNDNPGIRFNRTTLAVNENTGAINVAVDLDVPAQFTRVQPVSVVYTIVNGTAALGTDFTSAAASGTLTFPVGTNSRNIALTISNDAVDEIDETFTIVLSNPVDGTIITGEGTITITIRDNDGVPRVTLSRNPTSIPETNGTVTFTATLSTASGQTVTVNYATVNGTAVGGSDFNAVSGTLTFPAGTTTQTFTVTTRSDTTDESNEVFSAALSNPINVTLGTPSSVSVTILDDDP